MPQNKPKYQGDDDVIKRNMERSREVIEAKKSNADENAETPLVEDLDTSHEESPPGQANVPIGGYSNMNVAGGTSKRAKPN